MKFKSLLALGAAGALLASCGADSTQTMTYPETRTVDVVDTLWDTPVADPYRWLEDDRDPEVMAWVADQAETATSFLHGLPGREAWSCARGRPSPAVCVCVCVCV